MSWWNLFLLPRIEISLEVSCQGWRIFIFIFLAKRFYILQLRRKDLKCWGIMSVESSCLRCWKAFYLFQQLESTTLIFGSRTHIFSYSLQSIWWIFVSFRKWLYTLSIHQYWRYFLQSNISPKIITEKEVALQQ